MDLTLSEEHAELRKTVEEFARTVVAPVVAGLYERAEFPYDLARRMFFEGVKDSLRHALRTLQEGDMRPSPGDPCDSCDFGELCRRSRLFGEDDSPFGADLRTLGGGK